MANFTQKVAKIQKELKAPKTQKNKFGNYNYRNQEDILEAIKPLLGDLILTISDEMVEVGGRVYVKATAKISDGEGSSVSNTAFAREPAEQKGMSESQLTGTASSYARKYCLNGLFLIDDTKDADSNEMTALTRQTSGYASSNSTKTEPIAMSTQQAGLEPLPKKGGFADEKKKAKAAAPTVAATGDEGDLW